MQAGAVGGIVAPLLLVWTTGASGLLQVLASMVVVADALFWGLHLLGSPVDQKKND